MATTATAYQISRAAQVENGNADACSRFGNAAVLGFLVIQALDGVLTYLGVSTWGRSIEANPLVSASIDVFGLGAGLAAVKLVAVAFGIALHLGRVHRAVAALTAMYLAAAILPWAALFLTS